MLVPKQQWNPNAGKSSALLYNLQIDFLSQMMGVNFSPASLYTSRLVRRRLLLITYQMHESWSSSVYR